MFSKTIQLWAVDTTAAKPARAVPLNSVGSSETEEMLEELLARSPDLLSPDLTLIARQLPTAGGPLDLLGVDSDGRLVVFELKRGVLTRDAVAQVVDYASDIARMEGDRFARLVEDSSGRGGVDPISDFADWYAREYPTTPDPLATPPRMVLVGLGADERARRMVNFLADGGIEIELLTFHAFEADGKLFLARQVESDVSVASRGRVTPLKEENRRILHEQAEALGVKDFLEQVAQFLAAHIPAAYQWPGKTSYSFNLPDQTSEGKPTQRAYVTLYLDQKRPGSLLLNFPPRAISAAPEAAEHFCSVIPEVRRPNSSYIAVEARVAPALWEGIRESLQQFLSAIVQGWEAQSVTQQQQERVEVG